METKYVLLVLVAIAAVGLKGTKAASYTVGDSLGWTTGLPNTTFYDDWASTHTFSVGDKLIFNYTTGTHNVAEVNSAAYNSCSNSNPTAVYNSGPTTVTLNTTGVHYYVCLYTGHCGAGQKLSINVGGGSSSGSPPPPPSSPTAAAASPPPPPGSSGASSPGAPTMVFVSVVVGLFCYI